MMSGLITPKTIGFYSREDILKLMKVSKSPLRMSSYFTQIFVFWAVAILSIVPLYQNSSFKELLAYEIFNTTLWTIGCCHIYILIVWQIRYFYIICYYIKIKLKRINERIKSKISSRIKISDGLSEKFPTHFFRELKFIIWATISSIINSLIVKAVYGEMNFVMKFNE